MSFPTHPPKYNENPSKVINLLNIYSERSQDTHNEEEEKPWFGQCVDSVQETPKSHKQSL